MKLSRRLGTLTTFVPLWSTAADIGTDHAYLPVFLIEMGLATRVIASDVHKGPYQVAKQTVGEAGLTDKIDVRLGDGLQVLQPGEVQVAIIAGMGGGTIVEIFEHSPEVLAKLERLILQPMSDVKDVRRWLTERGWVIYDEDLLEEDGRLYEIIVFDQGESPQLNDMELLLGPCLLGRKHPLLKEVVERLISGNNKILAQLQNTNSESAKVKARELEAFNEELKKVKAWLQSFN